MNYFFLIFVALIFKKIGIHGTFLLRNNLKIFSENLRPILTSYSFQKIRNKSLVIMHPGPNVMENFMV